LRAIEQLKKNFVMLMKKYFSSN